jgi:1,4-dihydroxy-2-naphthoyl-CoA hydrolase
VGRVQEVNEPTADGLAGLIGIEYGELGPERATASLEVTDRVRQTFGIVHGGAYAAIAESICSAATYRAVAEDGMLAMGQSNQSSFLRPISAGHVHAEATVRHRGRTTWIWDCDLRDDEGRVCALVRMTVAVRPAPASG